MLNCVEPMDIVGPAWTGYLRRFIDIMDVGSFDFLWNDRQSLTATTIKRKKNSQVNILVPYRYKCTWFCRGDILLSGQRDLYEWTRVTKKTWHVPANFRSHNYKMRQDWYVEWELTIPCKRYPSRVSWTDFGMLRKSWGLIYWKYTYRVLVPVSCISSGGSFHLSIPCYKWRRLIEDAVCIRIRRRADF